MMNNVQRDFILGDKWFYFKLYTGVKTADTILAEIIQPLSSQLLEKELIDKWFFIRYSDPDFHLRVRFSIIDNSKIGEIVLSLNSALKPCLEQKLITRFQVDTYSRELERYGPKTIEEAESLFYYDSLMTMQMLDSIEGDEGEIYRWHFACMAVDSLLSDFGFDEVKKLNLTDRLQQGFGQEFGMNSELKVQIDKKFRDERQNIRSFIQKEDKMYEPFYQILKQKSNNSSAIIMRIVSLHSKKELELEFNNLIASYIHMLLNRIFKSKQRLNELMVYSLLFRYYRSEIARKRKAS